MKILKSSIALLMGGLLISNLSAVENNNTKLQKSAPEKKTEKIHENENQKQNVKKKSDPWKDFFPNGLVDEEGNAVDINVLKNKHVCLYFTAFW